MPSPTRLLLAALAAAPLLLTACGSDDVPAAQQSVLVTPSSPAPSASRSRATPPTPTGGPSASPTTSISPSPSTAASASAVAPASIEATAKAFFDALVAGDRDGVAAVATADVVAQFEPYEPIESNAELESPRYRLDGDSLSMLLQPTVTAVCQVQPGQVTSCAYGE